MHVLMMQANDEGVGIAAFNAAMTNLASAKRKGAGQKKKQKKKKTHGIKKIKKYLKKKKKNERN
ncbi:hypothetical protein [Escherichia coli]|uniref:hypothetical protein n=1 Tax=Escherichia coli TaxID=562 RepID=UPI0010CBC868|nr:hypothetical protein [Escherichia coli]